MTGSFKISFFWLAETVAEHEEVETSSNQYAGKSDFYQDVKHPE